MDFHIPGLETVGGYSMCSAPSLLQEKGELHLAVKYSDHKPAYWVHNKVSVLFEKTILVKDFGPLANSKSYVV